MAGILPLSSQSFGKMRPSPFLLCTNRTGEGVLCMLVALYRTEMCLLNFSDSTDTFPLELLFCHFPAHFSLHYNYFFPFLNLWSEGNLLFMFWPFKCYYVFRSPFQVSCLTSASWSASAGKMQYWACGSVPLSFSPPFRKSPLVPQHQAKLLGFLLCFSLRIINFC